VIYLWKLQEIRYSGNDNHVIVCRRHRRSLAHHLLSKCTARIDVENSASWKRRGRVHRERSLRSRQHKRTVRPAHWGTGGPAPRVGSQGRCPGRSRHCQVPTGVRSRRHRASRWRRVCPISHESWQRLQGCKTPAASAPVKAKSRSSPGSFRSQKAEQSDFGDCCRHWKATSRAGMRAERFTICASSFWITTRSCFSPPPTMGIGMHISTTSWLADAEN
jgi:hypothetical protein